MFGIFGRHEREKKWRYLPQSQDLKKNNKKKGYGAIMHRKKYYFGHAAKQCRFGDLAFVFVVKWHHCTDNALFRFNRFFMFKNRFLRFYSFLNLVPEFLTFDQFQPNYFQCHLLLY